MLLAFGGPLAEAIGTFCVRLDATDTGRLWGELLPLGRALSGALAGNFEGLVRVDCEKFGVLKDECGAFGVRVDREKVESEHFIVEGVLRVEDARVPRLTGVFDRADGASARVPVRDRDVEAGGAIGMVLVVVLGMRLFAGVFGRDMAALGATAFRSTSSR